MLHETNHSNKNNKKTTFLSLEGIKNLLNKINLISLKRKSPHHKDNNTISYSTPEEKKLINNVRKLGDLTIEDVMIPRTDINAIRYDITYENFKKLLSEERQHTRIPVYRDTLDDIVGFINIKDLVPILLKDKKFLLNEIIRELPLVSPSMKVIDLLAKMRTSRTHIALVIDEYGGTDGLVTIEDLVEEIVGDISDEYDIDEVKLFSRISDHKIVANARLAIEDLENEINLNLIEDKDRDSFDTLGGFILSLTGSVPKKGDKIIYKKTGTEFEILDSDPRKIKKVLIKFNHNET
jgi:magnesium and cobalt transporter